MIEYTWPGAYQISSVRSTTSWKISIKKKEVLTPNLHLNHKWNQHLLFWCTNQSQLQKKSIWISMELLSPFLLSFLFQPEKNTHAHCSAPTSLFCVIFFNVEISRSAALPLLPSGTCTSYPPTPLVSVYNLDQQQTCHELCQSLESSLISSNGSGSCDRTLNINPREGKDYTW